tara:strand:+ start:10628 stop:11422 length:795 start_codon:yes stop_codon:yes gene_type:complete
MCQLLGLSANTASDIRFSLSGLVQRGGATDKHEDGFGIAFYEGHGCRLFVDPEPSINSHVAEFLQTYPIRSKTIISHIRKANRGKVCLENTHPFVRECWGRQWVFAHNGQLKGIKKLPLKRYHPVGTTDSEYAFCWLMDQILKKYPKPPTSTPKENQKFWNFVHYLCLTIAELGTFNILFSDSSKLYTFCSTKLSCLTRRAPFGIAKLADAEMEIDLTQTNNKDDIITVIATEPLTKNEPWIRMNRNEMRVYELGKCVFQRTWE